MTEILLKMALNTINQATKQPHINKTINDFHFKSPNIQMTKKYGLEIQVLSWDWYRNVAGLNWLKEFTAFWIS
jgi:hypothetical protein